MATIYDVAKAAGVSPKTVSRVLNGDAPVNQKTRDAVLKAIGDLNYIPSSAARTMRSQRSGLVGMITGAISTGPEWSSPAGLPEIFIVQGAQRLLAEYGKTLLISDTGGRADRVPNLIQTFLEHRVEGLIYVAEYHQKVSLPVIGRNTPIVLANCFDDAGTPAVVPDDMGGQRTLVQALIDDGHERIGFLTLPDSLIARDLRVEGYKSALEENGIRFDPDLVVSAALADPAHEFDRLWDSVDRILRLKDRPTALCCGNDKMAMQVYRILHERGLSIPDDISVVGYDDYRIISEHVYPSLSTIDLPYGTIGIRTAETLLRLMDGAARTGKAPVDTVSGPLVWRNSVKKRDRKVTSITQWRS
ncbi:LacI family DNA-binding transcriptional regulator [Pelagibacterium xiamenense]|uniref:LacI family DNA-binding transcriptional regulator n=1 Tax=Pelagibacterium xiamenense TaxID=2901140 RepID=UPI001E323DDE|nr:LacI family DNA-binding transcriptional regulator [Pelagibacterium xiamenense]MCD7059557.1 LacI family DNA-binding transcriptional regulator [Pelagibacterium xiamenense]